MSALSVLLAARVALLAFEEPSPPANAPEELVLFIVPTDRATVDARALLDAVAIYTRDLHVRVISVRDESVAAPGLGARDSAVALLRSHR